MIDDRRKAPGGEGQDFEIAADLLVSSSARALVGLHLEGMRASSPAGHVFALDASGLLSPDVTVFSCRRAGEVVGILAVRDLGSRRCELKSMRTHPDHLRQGVGSALLDHVLQLARAKGFERVSLETGSGPAFEAAIRLYESRGFVEGPPFGGYEKSAFNRFLHLEF